MRFDQRNLFTAAISEVPVIGPYQVLGSAHIDMHSVYFFINNIFPQLYEHLDRVSELVFPFITWFCPPDGIKEVRLKDIDANGSK